MLRLLSLLQTGRAWSAADLADAAGATPRTLRRDLTRLRDLGYPVESLRGPGGHYRLVAGAALPPLMLEDDEAIACMVGLKLAAAGAPGPAGVADAAGRAAGKLTRVLPARLRRRADAVLAAVQVDAADDPQPAPALLGDLAAAATSRELVTFEHRGARGTAARTVEPVRLVRVDGRWYLFGWDRDREDWRSFRLDRVRDVHRTGRGFRARSLPADDVAALLHDRFRGPRDQQVILLLHADVEEAAHRLHRVEGTLEPLGPDLCRYVARVDSFEWLGVVLVLSDLEVTVEEPDAFRRHLADVATRLRRAAGSAWHPRMPTPPFVLDLRARIGHDLLWLPGVTAVVVRPGADGRPELLLVRRADTGEWTPVTGIIDPGEDPAVAGAREVLEEAEVVAVAERLAWVHALPPVTYANGDRSQYLDLTFRFRWVSGEPGPGDGENTDARWFPLDALPAMSAEMRARVDQALAPVEACRFVS